jgi:hypothetical protein
MSNMPEDNKLAGGRRWRVFGSVHHWSHWFLPIATGNGRAVMPSDHWFLPEGAGCQQDS